MPLSPRTDWDDKELPYSAVEVAHYEARVARITAEVGEIRAAVTGMRAEGDPFLDEVAAFCDRTALELERANTAPGQGVELRWEIDTREQEDYVPTASRRALLIARAWTNTHPGAGRD